MKEAIKEKDKLNISLSGRERLAICQLLNEYPMFRCLHPLKKCYHNNVLIIGSLSEDDHKKNIAANNEIFKAVFWCGQYPECELSITIAVTDPERLEADFYHDPDDPEKTYFELENYIKNKKYAKLKFKKIQTKGKSIDISGLQIEEEKYNYIIIKTGSDKWNTMIADLVKKQLLQQQNSKQRVQINVYQSDVTGSKKKTGILDFVKHDKTERIQTVLFGNNQYEYMDQLHDLEIVRLACNINLSYDMEFNERISEKQSKKQFDTKLKNDYRSNSFNAPGKNYDADSSIACAVHIPYKLNVCQEYAKKTGQNCSSLEMMMTAINEENELFTKLAVMEHRRWNAYMLTRGYHFPSETEMAEIFEIKGIKQKNKNERWHLCLCECSENGSLLSKKSSGFWKKNCKEPDESFSELDRMSLVYYDLARKKAKQIKNDIFISPVKQYNFLQNPELQELLSGIKEIVNDESPLSIAKYKDIYERTLANTAIDKDILKQVKDLDLSAFFETNNYRNFFETDEELIRMLPFCIWHGNKYKTAITISMGNAPDDVKIPTLLSVEKSIFVLEKPHTKEEKEKNKQYKAKVKSYFKLRGNNISSEFIELKNYSVEEICKSIETICEGQPSEDFIINLVECKDREEAVFAIGREGYKLQIPILKYDRTRGVLTYDTNSRFGSSINKKGFTIDEFLGLMGGTAIDESSALNSKQFAVIEDLFAVMSQEKAAAANKQPEETMWNRCVHFLQKNREKTDQVNTNNEPDIVSPQFKEYKFKDTVYYRYQIDEFLNDLSKYRIIDFGYYEDKTSVSIKKDRIVRKIKCYDSIVEETIRNISSINNDDSRFVKSYPVINLGQGMKVVKLGKEKINLAECDSEENQIKLIKFFTTLYENGLINFINEDGTISYCFNSVEIANLFEHEGNVFELITYNRFKETGLFNDIRTGIQFSWNVFEDQRDIDAVNMINKYHKYGLKNFYEIKNVIKKSPDYQIQPSFQNVSNEIDVLAIKGMTPVFVSCKATKNIPKGYIYEICSLAEQFGAIKILAVSMPSDNLDSVILSRAKNMGVSVIGFELLRNEKRLKEVLTSILNGNVFSPLDP